MDFGYSLGLPVDRIRLKPKDLNRHDAKNAMIGKVQRGNTIPDATAPRGAVATPTVISPLPALAAPGGVLPVKRFRRIRVGFADASVGY